MSHTEFSKLLSPGKIGTMEMKNRIVLPPMGTDAGEEGFVTEPIINRYAANAKGGTGLIITEVTCVDPPLGINTVHYIALSDDKYIPGFKKLTDTIHKYGAKCAIQLSHAGRGANLSVLHELGQPAVAPSEVAMPYSFVTGLKGETPRAFTHEEIIALEDKYADAAVRAKKAGYDAVEIHGAGYYLVAQFFSSTANQRTDEYGGNAYNRARFACNIIRKIKERCGKDFPVMIKMNVIDGGRNGGVTPLDGLYNCYLVQQAGADAIEVIACNWDDVATLEDVPAGGQAKGMALPLAGMVRKAMIAEGEERPNMEGRGTPAITIPLIAGGRTYDPVMAEGALANGVADFIHMGRGMITEPDRPNMIAGGTYPYARPCIGCQKCMDNQLMNDGELICSVNAVLGHDNNDDSLPLAEIKKNVMVIGGGPAGIEAARIAAMRGHNVTVYEAEDHLGGQLIPAVVPPYKENLADYIPYMEKQAEYRNFQVVTGKKIDKEDVKALQPDAVIAATGVIPAVLPIPGFEKPHVYNAKEVLLGAPVTDDVVIIGGGTVGCETAEYLLKAGKRVTVVEMTNQLMTNMVETTRFVLQSHIKELGCEILLETKCKEIRDEEVVVEGPAGERYISADTVVIATKDRPNHQLADEIKEICPEVYVIGDAGEVGSVMEAVRTGYVAGKQV